MKLKTWNVWVIRTSSTLTTLKCLMNLEESELLLPPGGRIVPIAIISINFIGKSSLNQKRSNFNHELLHKSWPNVYWNEPIFRNINKMNELEFYLLSNHVWWSNNCLNSSIAGWEPTSSLAGIFMSSTKTMNRFPKGGPYTPFRLLSNLLVMMS